MGSQVTQILGLGVLLGFKCLQGHLYHTNVRIQTTKKNPAISLSGRYCKLSHIPVKIGLLGEVSRNRPQPYHQNHRSWMKSQHLSWTLKYQDLSFLFHCPGLCSSKCSLSAASTLLCLSFWTDRQVSILKCLFWNISLRHIKIEGCMVKNVWGGEGGKEGGGWLRILIRGWRMEVAHIQSQTFTESCQF